MTPAEIIALARAEFGEITALTVTDQTARDFLNAAITELYEDLPPTRLKDLLSETSVALTSGEGDVLPTWDKVVNVYVDSVPALMVDGQVIHAHDYSQFFTSPTPIFAMDDSHIWVRPLASTCDVVYLTPPTVVTSGNEGTEYADISKVFHYALADLVTSYMYAQEEDSAQADLYRAAYTQKVGMLLAPASEGE